MARNELQGALDLLILKSLSHLGSMHGHGLAAHIGRASQGRLIIEDGSLYPALHRMEKNGWMISFSAISESDRGARYYKLTHAGRVQLGRTRKNWELITQCVDDILQLG